MPNNDFNAFIEASKLRIAEVLDGFKIGHGDIIATPGPAVTLFEFRPDYKVRMNKISNLKDNFTAALQSDGVIVIAPIPGKGTVGIEVPNKERQVVPMLDMLYAPEYMHTTMQLPLILGRKVNNSVFMADLATMPHLLIAGATGQGKSVGLNVILSSLLNKLSPDRLRLVLIDPKQVEFSVYNDIARPYLMKLPYTPDAVITDADEAKQAITYLCDIMDSRYSILKQSGVRNIQEYYKLPAEKQEPLPYIVVVIDEYADLIMGADGHELERSICRIAQKARAVGIHMIISTQRPDTKVITGTIKANFPTRIAFRTTTGTDSRVILDRIGAERLTGCGDMLFFSGADTTRVQCAYTSTEEVITLCRELCQEYTTAQQAYLREPRHESTNPQIHIEPTVIKLSDEAKRWAKRLAGHTEVTTSFFCGALDTIEDELASVGIISPVQIIKTSSLHFKGHTVLIRDIDELNRIIDEH